MYILSLPTLSMIAIDIKVATSNAPAMAKDTMNPGKPILQKIVTEKYLQKKIGIIQLRRNIY